MTLLAEGHVAARVAERVRLELARAPIGPRFTIIAALRAAALDPLAGVLPP